MIPFAMEAHPIPQNITSFEFKLVGDMTLKQFAFLGSGAVVAYLTFILLAAPAPIIAWPIILTSSFFGIAFAFIPIGDRPLDHWLKAFLKAIYSPTKMTWQRNGKKYSEEAIFPNRLSIYLQKTQPIQPNLTPPTPIQSEPTPPTIKPAPQLPTEEELDKTVTLAREAQALQVKIIETERQMEAIKTDLSQPGADPVKYTKQINELLTHLQTLVNQASAVKQQLSGVQQPTPIQTPKIIVVPAPKVKQTQLTLTSFPNVINGIVTDAAGNYLEGVVVVTHDKEGLPVRALKTNKLGQFTGSTPLPNGTYNVEFEKDNLSFDVLQVDLNGKVLPPVMAAAKKML